MGEKFRNRKIITTSSLKPADLGITINEKISIDYLYLDLNTCDRCVSTDMVLEEVLEIITPALKVAGFDLIYNKIEMATEELAIKHKFLSSPTIRVDGRDICLSVKESSCGCCSDISGTAVDCRVFEYKGREYEVPPQEMLAKAIYEAIFSKTSGNEQTSNYKLPDNLKKFYEGKRSLQS